MAEEAGGAGERGVEEAERLAEEFLKGLLYITPGFNRLTLMLHLLHKRVKVNADALSAFLGDEAVKAASHMGYLRVNVEEDGETISLAPHKAGWYLAELLNELARLVDQVEWPERLRQRYTCLLKAVPAALYTLATLKSIEESLERKGIAEGLGNLLSKAFTKAVKEDVGTYTIDDLKSLDPVTITKFTEEYGEEALHEVLNTLSGLGAFKYFKELGTINIDPDVVEGLKKALDECNPHLEKIEVRDIEKWLNNIANSIS